MAKKPFPHKIQHVSSGDDSVDVKLEDNQKDTDLFDKNLSMLKPLSANAISINHIYLEPAGYPIKPFDAPDELIIKIEDEKLFQSYATEQWDGLIVKKNDYIFDQIIIPDFAFKIKKIIPAKGSIITSETKFHVQNKKSKRAKINPIRFDEIIGNQIAKDKAQIIIKYLKNPKKFGEWAPKNILFYGPPGTGKTLMARAIATAAKCPFFARKGTTLIGLHVGDGAAKIHSLFKQARKEAPSIIFIDELDSIGLNRSYQTVRGDVVEVSTALLAEMDGLEQNEGVILIGATNGIDLLDLGLRSRFEEEIEFPKPNEEERKSMIELFVKKVPVPVEMNSVQLARLTEGWSGRDIHEKLIKVAVHRAIQKNLSKIDNKLFLDILKSQKNEDSKNHPPKEFFS